MAEQDNQNVALVTGSLSGIATTVPFAMAIRGSSLRFPIDNVRQIPLILKQVELYVAIPVNGNLCRWEQCTGTLSCVLVVDVNLSCCQVECPRPRVPRSFRKCNPTVGNETHSAAGWRRNNLLIG